MRARGRHALTFLVALVVVLLPRVALANAGTVLMWAEVFHLFIGNLLIGILEGVLLRLIFRARLIRSVLIMVAANYLSMIAGAALSKGTLTLMLASPSLYEVHWFVNAGLPVSFAVTVILEWPFVRAAFAGLAKAWRKAFIGSLAIQTASYALIVPLYLTVSDTRLFASARIVPSPAFVENRQALVYFISSDDALCRIRLDGSGLERVPGVHMPGNSYRLTALPHEGSELHDLWSVRRATDSIEPPYALILPEFSRVVSVHDDGLPRYAPMFDYPVSDLRSEPDRPWHFELGYGFGRYLTFREGDDWESLITLGLETPFLHWSFAQATVLPGDEVVFQLGPDIICVFDRETRKLAQLARGRGPVVVLPDVPESGGTQ